MEKKDLSDVDAKEDAAFIDFQLTKLIKKVMQISTVKTDIMLFADKHPQRHLYKMG